jgi:putative ABC transport system permease protein
MEAQTVIATPEYFRTLGIKLVNGRPFTDGDVQGAPAVVIINESLARHLSPSQNPLGKQLELEATQYPDPDSVQPRTAQIVGVVGDSKQWGVTEPLHDMVYVPFAQNPAPSMFVVAKTRIPSSALVDSVRTAVSEIDPDQPVYDVQMMTERIRASELERRFNATLLVLFAGLALVATAVGIYGTLAFWVAQRTHEIGVRMALGAGTREVLSLVVRKIARLMFVGLALGLPASFAIVRLIRSFVYGGQPSADMFYGVSSVDPMTMLAVFSVLIGSAALATVVPAWRATRVDLARGLQVE